ncbi:MAG: NUMOD4 domain-containing protein [Bacteroidota bacterium]
MGNNYNTEEWRLLEFEGLHPDEKYEISSFGRLRRWDKKREEWKLVKLSNSKGYLVYSFKSADSDKYSITKTIHKLVAEVFVEKPAPGHDYVIHVDYRKDNNHIKNLKWVTKKDMYVHHRTNPNYKRGQINNAKLSETEVIRLKLKLKRGKNKLYKIAKEFGITHTQLNRIRSGENWGHIKVD